MTTRSRNYREKFIGFHQGAVLTVGLIVMVVSPEGNYSFFLPFGIALAPILFSAFARPEALAELDGNTPRWRTYRLSSFLGILCALVLMAMWFAGGIIAALRELGSAH